MTNDYSNSRSKWQVRIAGYYPVKSTTKPKTKPELIVKGDFNPPKHEIQAFARCILPAIQDFFDTERGRREFAEWMEQQHESNKSA